MMTIDDEGEGGVWPNDDVITEIQFLANFWDFAGYFTKIFLKKSQVNSKLNQIMSALAARHSFN